MNKQTRNQSSTYRSPKPLCKRLNRLQENPKDIIQVGRQNPLLQVSNNNFCTRGHQDRSIFKISSSRKASRHDNSFYIAFVQCKYPWLSISSGSDGFILKYHARGDITRFKHSNSEVNNWNWYKWHLEIYSVVLCRLSQILLGLPGTFYSTYILLESGNRVFNPRISLVMP